MKHKPLQARIEAHLKTLKLNHLLDALPQELDRVIEEKWPAAVWLEKLLALEVAKRLERRIERRIRACKLPERKLLQDFDFQFQTGVDKAQIMALAELDFLGRQRSLVFGGHSGTGNYEKYLLM